MELEFQQLELRYEPLRLRSPERERRLLASLAERGQQTPIVVVGLDAPQRYVVIDGYKRVRALRRLGQDTVRSTRWEVEEAEALVLEQQMHRVERDSALEQGWLLRELHQRFGWSQEDLARRFDRSTSWVSRRLGLVKELPEEIQQRVRSGQIVPHAAMKYLVPLARANRRDCLRLAEAVGGQRLSSRQMEKLYVAYVTADEPLRELVLSQPELFLRVEQEAQQAPSVGARPVEGLMSDLSVLGAVCRRALRRWEMGLALKLVPPERERAHRLFRQVMGAFDELVHRCEKELGDVGSESAEHDPDAEEEGLEHPADRSRTSHLPPDGEKGAENGQRLAALDPAGGESRTLSGRDSGALPVL